MANYSCTVRTNYFRVKDEEKFKNLMNRVDGGVKLFEEQYPLFGFGCYGSISGVVDDEGEVNDNSFDDFIDELMDCVAEDDAIIMLEAGNENLRYVIGQALIITSKKYEWVDIQHIAVNKAAEMLSDPDWTTVCEY